jgi:hypothetical protein
MESLSSYFYRAAAWAGVVNKDALLRVDGQQLKIGDLDDGGVYVGKSATDGKDLHAALTDEPDYLTFDEALVAAEKMRNQPGRQNAHVPTLKELDKNLFHNRNTGHLKNTFNTSGSYPASVYRSCTLYCHSWAQYFDDGDQTDFNINNRLPVRLVW